MAYVKENDTIQNSSNPINRNGILSKAESIINGERQGTYGDAEDSFQTIADMWSAYLNTEISSEDVANMMILMKRRGLTDRRMSISWVQGIIMYCRIMLQRWMY